MNSIFTLVSTALFLLVCCSIPNVSFGFSVTSLSSLTQKQQQLQRPKILVLQAKKSKGFGNVPETSSSSSNKKESPSDSVATTAASSSSPDAAAAPVSSSSSSSSSSGETVNAGQRALNELRRQKAEQRDAELRKVRELLEQDEQAASGGTTATAIPEKVAQRMGQRMLPFVGIPLFGTLGSFVGFWYMATYKNMEFQPAMVATTSVFLLVVSLLGITYSVLSASWDPDREGDFMGTEEFNTNLQNIKDGLARSRQNAILREQLANMTDEEVSAALADLERREKAKEKKELQKTSTLQDKLSNELK